MTIRVSSDLPIRDETFSPRFRLFQVEEPGPDSISIHHHFALPDLAGRELGATLHDHAPWEIHRSAGGWTYLQFFETPAGRHVHRVALFNDRHTEGHIYHEDGSVFLAGNADSLTLFPTDQILLARVLADLEACYVHSAGMVLNGRGFLFVGHSEAGKSTTVGMLRDEGEILCDDRNVIRRWPDGFRVHGTWSHGTVPTVSPGEATLRAICLIEKAEENRLIPLTDRAEIARTLPFYVIKPAATAEWWNKVLDLIGRISREVPVYRLRLDRSGQVREVLRPLWQ